MTRLLPRRQRSLDVAGGWCFAIAAYCRKVRIIEQAAADSVESRFNLRVLPNIGLTLGKPFEALPDLRNRVAAKISAPGVSPL